MALKIGMSHLDIHLNEEVRGLLLPQHLHSTTKPNKNHTTHTIITPKAQTSAPKFHAKTTTSHLQ